MNEDALYRSSSQYRFWSFTPSALSTQRAHSNTLAATQLAALLPDPHSPTDASPLTPAEELHLLTYYTQNLLSLGISQFQLPLPVVATALTFLKRFYTTHSLMTHPPKSIMPTALFLASKTENWTTSLDGFLDSARGIQGLERLSRDSVLSREFAVVQALRFGFEVKHAFRGLKGLWLDLCVAVEICAGRRGAAGWCRAGDDEVREKMLGLEGAGTVPELERRLGAGYARAKEVLQDSALLSDAYFHYTPSQITFAAWSLAQPDVVRALLDLKLGGGVVPVKEKHRIEDTISSCAAMLRDFAVVPDHELKPLNKKMLRCNKLFAAGLAGKGVKRTGNTETQAEEERKAKKRKLERERLEKDGTDLFGPSL